MSTVLITGAGGFLGAWILRQLAEGGHHVRIFDRSADRRIVSEIAGDLADGADWVAGDVTDTAAVAEAARGCHAIIHLAALLTPACQADPILGAKVNLIGTLNAFEAAKTNGIAKVVYASSAGIFGSQDGATPYPVTQYGAFKLACEGCARAYFHDAGVSSVGFRPTVVYGPGRESGLTAGPTIACREAAAGRPYTIGYSGPQDLVFVADVAANFAAAATRPIEGAHVLSVVGGTHDVPEVIAAIRTEIHDAAIDFAGPLVPMASQVVADDNEALLGPLPHTPLSEGVAQTIAHYRALAGAG